MTPKERAKVLGQQLHKAALRSRTALIKAGDLVCFNGDPADIGTVIATEARYVTIRWQDGHRSLTGHKNMQRVELAKK